MLPSPLVFLVIFYSHRENVNFAAMGAGFEKFHKVVRGRLYYCNGDGAQCSMGGLELRDDVCQDLPCRAFKVSACAIYDGDRELLIGLRAC